MRLALALAAGLKAPLPGSFTDEAGRFVVNRVPPGVADGDVTGVRVVIPRE